MLSLARNMATPHRPPEVFPPPLSLSTSRDNEPQRATPSFRAILPLSIAAALGLEREEESPSENSALRVELFFPLCW
jgi:hypothetical protein